MSWRYSSFPGSSQRVRQDRDRSGIHPRMALPALLPVILGFLVVLAAQPAPALSVPEAFEASGGLTATLRATVPHVSIRESALLADLADGRLDQTPLIAACLIAGGTQASHELQPRLEQWEAFRQRLLHRPHTPRSLLETVHQQLLGEYVHDADSLEHLLRTGDYNCMSVSLLYLTLCADLGIDAHAVATRGHVRVHVDCYPEWDLETTCAAWSEALVARTAPDVAGETWRDLTTIEFLAKIYFNRATRAIQRGRWADAIALAATACQLDPQDHSAAANRLAAYNEWALAACETGDYALALQLLHEALRCAPSDPALTTNYAYVLHRQAVLQQANDRGSQQASREHVIRGSLSD